jgi:hypothetical protein
MKRIGLLLMILLLCAWSYKSLPMHECAWCHRVKRIHKPGFLNRHHLIAQSFAPELRDVRSNLIVLCRKCHFVLGHRCRWKTYNPDCLEIITVYTNTVTKGG